LVSGLTGETYDTFQIRNCGEVVLSIDPLTIVESYAATPGEEVMQKYFESKFNHLTGSYGIHELLYNLGGQSNSLGGNIGSPGYNRAQEKIYLKEIFKDHADNHFSSYGGSDGCWLLRIKETTSLTGVPQFRNTLVHGRNDHPSESQTFSGTVKLSNSLSPFILKSKLPKDSKKTKFLNLSKVNESVPFKTSNTLSIPESLNSIEKSSLRSVRLRESKQSSSLTLKDSNKASLILSALTEFKSAGSALTSS